MSPEMNGNPPPIAKRKKNKNKANTSASKSIEPAVQSYNCFQNGLSSYPNLHFPDGAFPPIFNYSVPTEPMSLPVFPPNYQGFPSMGFNYPGSRNGPSLGFGPFGHGNEGNEYASLPVGLTDQNDNNDKRRFSDPGLLNDSDSSGNSVDGRLIQKLTQQVNSLRESNRKLSRDVMELKVEMSILKQQQGSRNFERGEYEPGMLADVIREVRDAARVREDALLARVKHMIEEKQLTLVSFE